MVSGSRGPTQIHIRGLCHWAGEPAGPSSLRDVESTTPAAHSSLSPRPTPPLPSSRPKHLKPRADTGQCRKRLRCSRCCGRGTRMPPRMCHRTRQESTTPRRRFSCDLAVARPPVKVAFANTRLILGVLLEQHEREQKVNHTKMTTKAAFFWSHSAALRRTRRPRFESR